VSAWLEAARIVEGALFRSVHQKQPAETPLNVSSVQRLVKRAAKRAGVAYEVVKGLSGHSMRIGAAQDMTVAGFDSLAIMQAAGWKTQHVLLRYVENASTRAMHERRSKALAEKAA
jgi:integrase/recombinase XerD